MKKPVGSATPWKVSIEAVVGSPNGSVAIASSVSLDFVTKAGCRNISLISVRRKGR